MTNDTWFLRGFFRRSARVRRALLCGLALVATCYAGAARAASAAPLGMEIGVATYDQVKERIGKSTALNSAGINKYTGGQMLSGNGEGLDVAGLSEITFIFDRAGVLQGVLMTLAKDFRPTYERLRKKYKLVSQKIPFVGNSYAKFAQETSVIILDAPHLSFDMTLSYVSPSFLAAYKARSSEEDAQRERAQQDRL
jgi:hypothetical protein